MDEKWFIDNDRKDLTLAEAFQILEDDARGYLTATSDNFLMQYDTEYYNGVNLRRL